MEAIIRLDENSTPTSVRAATQQTHEDDPYPFELSSRPGREAVVSLNVSPWRLVFGAAAALLQCTQAAHSQRRSSEEAEGVWEGSVYVVGVVPDIDHEGFRLGDSTRLRLELFPSSERVSVTSPDLPGLQMIHLGQLHSSAVVAGVIERDGYIENWALTVTLQDERTMLVALSRGVSLTPGSEDARALTVGALGQLRRNDDD